MCMRHAPTGGGGGGLFNHLLQFQWEGMTIINNQCLPVELWQESWSSWYFAQGGEASDPESWSSGFRLGRMYLCFAGCVWTNFMYTLHTCPENGLVSLSTQRNLSV